MFSCLRGQNILKILSIVFYSWNKGIFIRMPLISYSKHHLNVFKNSKVRHRRDFFLISPIPCENFKTLKCAKTFKNGVLGPPQAENFGVQFWGFWRFWRFFSEKPPLVSQHLTTRGGFLAWNPTDVIVGSNVPGQIGQIWRKKYDLAGFYVKKKRSFSNCSKKISRMNFSVWFF